jgi:hypothetical protein
MEASMNYIDRGSRELESFVGWAWSHFYFRLFIGTKGPGSRACSCTRGDGSDGACG